MTCMFSFSSRTFWFIWDLTAVIIIQHCGNICTFDVTSELILINNSILLLHQQHIQRYLYQHFYVFDHTDHRDLYDWNVHDDDDGDDYDDLEGRIPLLVWRWFEVAGKQACTQPPSYKGWLDHSSEKESKIRFMLLYLHRLTYLNWVHIFNQ